MRWGELETILEVVENDGLQGAAKALGVHSTTISRRVREIEARAQTRLFERYRHGVALTEAGAEAVEAARRVRVVVDGLSARLSGRDTELSGTVRLATLDSIFRSWMPHFARFRERYPDIVVELNSGMDMANLTQREADVALRIAGSAPEHLVGAKLCDVAHGVYASTSILEQYGEDASRGDFPWVAYDLSVFRGIDAFLAARHPRAKIVMRVPRIDLLVAAIEGGIGIGVLKCHAGDANPKLRRLGPADAGTSHLWLLTHPHLRGAARISAFMRFAREIVASERDLFEGRRPLASDEPAIE